MKEWFVYMIESVKGRLYTGITTDPDRRFSEHATGIGAKFFRSDAPAKIVFLESHPDRSSASKREAMIKKLNKAGKEAFLEEQSN
jgi:putative endonuclease